MLGRAHFSCWDAVAELPPGAFIVTLGEGAGDAADLLVAYSRQMEGGTWGKGAV